MSYEEPKSRMSFGNILLSLLLLGTIIVIGLIVLVYFKLTNPSERTNVAPVSVSAPVRPVEKLVPSGTTMVSASEAAASASDGNATASVRQPPLLIPYSEHNSNQIKKDADEAVNALNANTGRYNSRALTDGAAVPRKPVAPRRRNTQTENAENTAQANTSRSGSRSARNNNQAGEVPLKPTNVPQERSLTPRNSASSQERPLTPRNTASSQNNNNSERPRRTYTAPPRNTETQGERVLAPTRPAKKSNGAIDELF